MLTIDGSWGEGGGQLVRTSVALAALTGKSVRIVRIRARRSPPGLKAQHVEAIEILRKITNAIVKGNEIGSEELEFIPKENRGGSVEVSISTAGSIALALQGVTIAAVRAVKHVEVLVHGGAVAGKWAPPMNYLRLVLSPLLRQVGYETSFEILRYGYYPKGGAKARASFAPSKLKKIELIKRGKLVEISGIVHASKELKKRNVAERIASRAEKIISSELGIDPRIEVTYVDSSCPGCGIELVACFENTVIGADALGEPKKSAEAVGEEAAKKLVEEVRSGACIDTHAGDHLIPFLAISALDNGEPTELTVSEISTHTQTNMWVVEKFLPVEFEIEGNLIRCIPKITS